MKCKICQDGGAKFQQLVIPADIKIFLLSAYFPSRLAFLAEELDFGFIGLEDFHVKLDGNLDKNHRILIVDDDDGFRGRCLKEGIESLGYGKVEHLKTPFDFFDRLHRNSKSFIDVGCLITDYQFTVFDDRYVMSGTAFIQVIREGITVEKLKSGLSQRIGTTPGSGVRLG